MKLTAALLLSAAFAFGQDAQLTGLISDPSKAIVPNAEVIVTNADNGLQRTVHSNRGGYYTVPFLPPGVYTIIVHAPGFQAEQRKNVTLEVEQEARLDFTLPVRTNEQTVMVTSEARCCKRNPQWWGQWSIASLSKICR